VAERLRGFGGTFPIQRSRVRVGLGGMALKCIVRFEGQGTPRDKNSGQWLSIAFLAGVPHVPSQGCLGE
jgi:hypothetical protein